MSFLYKSFIIARKDVLSEMRTKEIVFTVLVFALMVIVIFNFAFTPGDDTIQVLAPGMLWVTFAFAGVLSLNRTFVSEKEEGCLEGLMVCPVSREAIYVGKMLGALLFMLIVEAIATPIFAFLFNLNVLTTQFALITFLTTIGFAAVGTLFSALAINTKSRETVLPILFLPIIAPIIICAVKASGTALASDTSWEDLSLWLQIIVAYDVIFFVVSFWVFSLVIEE